MKPVYLLLLISTTALADDAGLLRCRGIADPAARLACYDALPVPTPEARPEAPPPAAAPAQKPEQFGMPSPKPAQKPEQFGMPPPKPAQVELDAIESTIPGHFGGWGPNSRIRLANGQVWQVVDGSSRALDMTNPKVVIRRGVLSAFYLEFENDNRTVRVKRLE